MGGMVDPQIDRGYGEVERARAGQAAGGGWARAFNRWESVAIDKVEFNAS